MNAIAITPPKTSKSIADQNDLFRKSMTDLRARYDANDQRIMGQHVVTRGIQACGITQEAMKQVAAFNTFTNDNDPHGEHDWGSFTLIDADGDEQTVNWKIDYYSDKDCDWGSEEPADPTQTFRLLTIMLLQEA